MSISTRQFELIRRLVRRRRAIVLAESQRYLVDSRLETVARREGLDSVDALVERIHVADEDVLEVRVLDALTTNETSFFRDQRPFDAVRQTLLPTLIRARANERRLRIWSAACSSGQEPLSLWMTIREHFPELRSWDVRILASDVSQEMLARARTGRYSGFETSRGLSTARRSRHFTRDGGTWRVHADVYRCVDYRRINLIDPWPSLPPMDLVLLRNALIYFDLETRRCLLERLRAAMRPDACLLLGATETTMNLTDAFVPTLVDQALVYHPAPAAHRSEESDHG